QAFNSSQFNCGLYNVTEYLAGLAKLGVNDKFLLYFISKDGILDLFIRKFLEFNTSCTRNDNVESTDLNTLICASLYTIFWSISFQSDYSTKLKENNEFIEFVQQVSTNESTDENIVAMKRAAKGILFNLDLIQTDLQPIDDTDTDDDHVKAMISYAHKDTKLCQTLVSKLEGRVRGDVWVDFIKLQPPYEDDWEEIACAITQCDVVLMLVTENYCTSKSCRREVIHADKRNKRIIPIYQGKEYQPEDWFEIRVGSATFVRFGDGKSDEKVMETLLNLIHATDKRKRSFNKTTSHEAPTSINQQQTVAYIVPSPVLSVSPVLPRTQPISSPMMENLRPQAMRFESTSDTTPNQSLPTINRKPVEQWTNAELLNFLQLPPTMLDLSSGQAALTYIRLLTNDDSLEIKCWFRQNLLSDYLFNIFTFDNGDEFLTYATLVTQTPTRIDVEYDRLKSLIQNRYNPQDPFALDEYARFVNAMKKLIIRSQSSSSISSHTTEEPAQCTIS
ncbi:unnamed protein product, partial [Rotaria socialis]